MCGEGCGCTGKCKICVCKEKKMDRIALIRKSHHKLMDEGAIEDTRVNLNKVFDDLDEDELMDVMSFVVPYRKEDKASGYKVSQCKKADERSAMEALDNEWANEQAFGLGLNVLDVMIDEDGRERTRDEALEFLMEIEKKGDVPEWWDLQRTDEKFKLAKTHRVHLDMIYEDNAFDVISAIS